MFLPEGIQALDSTYLWIALAIMLALFTGGFISFLIIRQFILWYWRINEMANNIAFIAIYYRQLGPPGAQLPRPPTPMGQPLPPALSPRVPSTLEEQVRRMRSSGTYPQQYGPKQNG
jgi:hypothetical protein